MSWYVKVLRQYVDFQGRARRREFWVFVLVTLIVAVVLQLADVLLGTDGMIGMRDGARSSVLNGLFVFPTGAGLISGLYVLATFLPSLAVLVRRLHDRDHTGWWVLILLVPIIGFVVMLLFTISESRREPNRYGADPHLQTSGHRPR